MLLLLGIFRFVFVGREVDWVQCDGGCNEWFHMLCVGLIKSQVKPDDDFICKKCKKTTGPNDVTSATAATTTATTTTTMTTTTRSNRKTTTNMGTTITTGTTSSVKKRCVRNKDEPNAPETSISDTKEPPQQNDGATAKEKEVSSDKTRSKNDSSQLEALTANTPADSTTPSPAKTALSTSSASSLTTTPTPGGAKKSNDTKSTASTAPTVPLKKKKNQQKL